MPVRRRNALLLSAAAVCCTLPCRAWLLPAAHYRRQSTLTTATSAGPPAAGAGLVLSRWQERHGRCRARITTSAWSCVRSRTRNSGWTAPTALHGAPVQPSETQEDLIGAFEGICDGDGLLSLQAFMTFDEVAALMEDGLLGREEVENIWAEVAGSAADRLDVDGFLEAFGMVDDLFEDVEEPEGGAPTGLGIDGQTPATSEDAPDAVSEDVVRAFEGLAGARGGAVTLQRLLQWGEVRALMEEGQITAEEVGVLFARAPKAPGGAAGAAPRVALAGFARFAALLDELFEEVDEEEEEEGQENIAHESANASAAAAPAAVAPAAAPAAAAAAEQETAAAQWPEAQADDEPLSDVEAEFVSLAGSLGGTLSLADILEWETISELVADGQMDREEVMQLWADAPKFPPAAPGAKPRIGLQGFVALNAALDDLFELEDEEDEDEPSPPAVTAPPPPPPAAKALAAPAAATAAPATAAAAAPAAPEATFQEAKARVLSLAQQFSEDCGVGAEARERSQVLRAVDDLLRVSAGRGINIAEDGADKAMAGLVGSWRLLYTSSRSVEFNQGLTGIARTVRGSKFSGLMQALERDGQMLDCTYTEELGAVQVTITGDWEVRETTSLLSGARSVALDVTTKRVKYGFISVIGERWKPLRAMALLDVIYLDQDLRVMRGQTSTNTIFILKREDN